MSEVSLFLADGFEEIEGLTVVDLLRRAKIDVDMVSVMGRKEIVGAHQIKVVADTLIEEMDFSHSKMLVLPGGMPGTLYLKEHAQLRSLLLTFYEEGKQIAAICAAPTVFGDLGILEGKRAVCYPGMEDGLVGATVCFDPVMTDGTITTSRGMGTAIDFSLRLIALLKGREEAERLAEQIVYKEGKMNE